MVIEQTEFVVAVLMVIIALVAEREDTDRYPGLMVGSVDNANNNAGNWE